MIQPHNTPTANGYILAHDYEWRWKRKGKAYRIYVPKGFEYDGASVPRLAWTLSGLTPDGLIRAAALIHDWIYEHKGKLPKGSWQVKDGKWRDVGTVWKRKHADKIFKTIMLESGVSRYRANVAYAAVRLGGWIAWRD